MTSLELRRAAAFHEAGHVIAARMLLGARCRVMMAPAAPGCVARTIADYPEDRGETIGEQLRLEAICILAGSAAQERGTGKPPDDHAVRRDLEDARQRALEAARILGADGRLAAVVVDHWSHEAERVIDQLWPEIMAIAAVLEDVDEMDADTIEAIVAKEKTGGARRPARIKAAGTNSGGNNF